MKCLAFDLGMVVFDFDYNIALKRMENKLGVCPEEVIDALYNKDFALDFEKGLLSGYEFYLQFKNEFKANLNYEEFVDAWCKIFHPKDEVIKLIRRLKERYPLYLISNINELHFKYLYQEFSEVFSLFNKLLLSFEIKSVKPEEKIYQELKRIANQEAKDIVYIDDRQDLIEEAKKLNFKCIRFKNFPSFIRTLEEIGIFFPPEK